MVSQRKPLQSAVEPLAKLVAGSTEEGGGNTATRGDSIGGEQSPNISAGMTTTHTAVSVEQAGCGCVAQCIAMSYVSVCARNDIKL